MVEFVSYSGKYPNLCGGELVLRINDKEVNLGQCLCSGGRIKHDYKWDNYLVDIGAWSVNIPEEFAQYTDEITKVVNDNVLWGCCGGCI